MKNIKHKLTIQSLIREAELFCKNMSKTEHKKIKGITDGKAIGTYIEHKFKNLIKRKYEVVIGSSSQGIDFPEPNIETDLKTTFITQPQSSCPFKNARQKIYGLGYNLLIFVYQKNDNKKFNLEFLHARFIHKHRTADYQITTKLNEIIKNKGNIEDIESYLIDRNLPVDEIELNNIANEILKNPPPIGYLTISNALQWRLQYTRIISIQQEVEGVIKIYDK